MSGDPSAGWLSMSSKELCRTRVLSLMSERSRCLRTGAENDFITFKCPDWVNVIAATSDGRLVMIRQFRHGSGRTELEIPGGCMESSDPDPVAAGARELLEETGFAGDDGRVIGSVCPNPALQGNTCFTVKFDNARKVSEPRMEDTEAVVTELLPEVSLRGLAKAGGVSHGLVLNALLFHWLEESEQTI